VQRPTWLKEIKLIRKDKFDNALYALQGVLIFARKMAYENKAHKEIADILDTAEYLPYLISNNRDETENFRNHLLDIVDKYGCHICVERFDGSVTF
jgi:hypothetical protein